VKNQLSDLGEDRLVEHLVGLLEADGPRREDVRVGAGDDCAVIACGGRGEDLLFKTDAVIEGVHYLPTDDPGAVGAKAINRAISDIAAMGGRPTHALLTLACPNNVSVDSITLFYRGCVAAARRFDIAVVGGDTAGLPDRNAAAMFSVSLIGGVPAGKAVLRSGARCGDTLYVTGALGGSLSSGRHLSFTPRVEAGCWLRDQGVNAMMDLSDGLGIDLPRMAHASGCGFVIDPDDLPLHAGCTVADAMGDGEDYELLIASAVQLPARCPDGLPITRIGAMAPRGEGHACEGGWEHFK
jgi:thiamine-monophosphate kinase